MTKEEYAEIAKEINERYKAEVIELNKRYALESADYRVGDIIEDHIGKGRILKIDLPVTDNLDTRWGHPSLSYIVENLTKKGEINKREPQRTIYGVNIKSNNNE